jgi:hypothetical protein
MNAPIFLNLDLDIESEKNLEPLAVHLDKCASLLHSGEYDGFFRITVESRIGGHSGVGAEECTEELLNTIESLPGHLHALFSGSRVRTFDYGFESGSGSKPCIAELPASQLARISKLGIGIRVTIYQDHEEAGKIDA